MKVVLTIGGSDASGGAGIQSDIKTIMANGCFGTSVITAIAVHNKKGTRKVENVRAETVALQLDLTIDAASPDAVKVGMLPDAETVHAVAEKIKEYKLENVVVNPFLITDDGEHTAPEETFDAVVNELLPLADIITPDLNELEALSGMKCGSKSAIITASKAVSEKYDCIVATKGGKVVGDAADLFFRQDYYKWFPGMIIDNANLHDAGNAMSCAVAANLAKGYDPDKAFKCAKDFVTELLLNMEAVGKMPQMLGYNSTVSGTFTGVLSDEDLSRM